MESWRAEFDERFPIYQQIVDRFCYSLVKGEITAGDRIPSIRDMALILKVNTNTIQRAYQEMERKNLIYSQRGTGYFVMEDQNMITEIKNEMVQNAAARFLDEMRALGFTDKQIIKELEQQLRGGTIDAANDNRGH